MSDNTFKKHKSDIEKAINKKLADGILSDKKGFTLIEGFINMPLQDQLGGMVLGGPSIPTVAIVGNDSGLIYTFALKALLPNIQL